MSSQELRPWFQCASSPRKLAIFESSLVALFMLLNLVISPSIGLVVISTTALAAGEETTGNLSTQPGQLLYQVQRGEHLTEILRSMGFKNLWGRNGIVQRTIAANPQVKNPNQLEPGTTIRIVATSIPNTAAYETVNGQVRHKSPAGEEKGNADLNSAAAAASTAAVLAAQAFQSIEVVCPDQSVHQVRARLIPASSAGQPSRLLVQDQQAICAPAVSAPPTQTANPEQGSETSKEATGDSANEGWIEAKPRTEATPPATSEGEAKPSPSDRPIQPIHTGPQEEEGKVDESLPKNFDPLLFADDVLYKKHPFSLALQGGYSNDAFQFGNGGSPILNGWNFGVRAEYHVHRKNWGFLIGVGYRQARFSDSGPGADYLVLNMLEPALGISWRQWILRVGMPFNQGTDANATWNASFGDSGWFASVSRSFYLSKHVSVEGELRYTNVIYTTGDNSSLSKNSNSTQYEAIVSLGYHF